MLPSYGSGTPIRSLADGRRRNHRRRGSGAGHFRVTDRERARLHAPSRSLTLLALLLVALGGGVVALGAYAGYVARRPTPLCVAQLIAGCSATGLAMAVIWLRPLWCLRPPLAQATAYSWGVTLAAQLFVAATLARRRMRADLITVRAAERAYLVTAAVVVAALSLCEGALLLAARRGTARAFDAERALDDARAAMADAERDAHCSALESQDPFDAEFGGVSATFQAEARRSLSKIERILPKPAVIKAKAQRLIDETERILIDSSVDLGPIGDAIARERERERRRERLARKRSPPRGTQLGTLTSMRADRGGGGGGGFYSDDDGGDDALLVAPPALVRAVSSAGVGGVGAGIGGIEAASTTMKKKKKKKKKKSKSKEARLESTYGKYLAS